MALPNNPITRKEMYLSNMAGQGTALPDEPITREEEYLDYIAKNGGGGTGDGDMKKSVYDSDLAVSGAGGIKAFVNGQTNDLQPKTLDTPITIGGVQRTTVEAALGALEDNKEDTILAATPLVKEYDEVMRQEVLRLTMDNAPTEDSGNPVTSDGVKSAVSATVDLLKDTTGWTGKNKFPNKTNTVGNNTYTVDSSGYASTAVASDGRTWSYANSNIKFTLKKGTYKVRGYEKTASTSGYTGFHILDNSDNELLVVSNWNSFMTDALTLTLAQDTNIGVEYKLGNGEYAFMIADTGAYDLSPAFEPFHESVEEVKADKSSVISALDDTVGWVSKNKNYHNAQTSTAGTVTYTVNANKSIELSGVTTTPTIKDLRTYTGAELKALGRKLVLSGGNAKAYLAIRTLNYTFIARSYGDAVEFDTSTLEDATTYYETIGVSVPSGSSVDLTGVVIYPMITTPEEYKLSPAYAPYHESVAEMLTPKSLPNNADLNDYTNEGDYIADASVNTYTNIPPVGSTSFRFKVLPFNASASRCIQIIYVNKTEPEVYMRTNNAGTWRSWYKFTGTVVS